jgi:hypothetical protein
MRRKLTAVILAVAIAACGGGGGDDPGPTPGADLDEGLSGFTGAVNRANDVGDAANQRLTDIQDQLTTP